MTLNMKDATSKRG